MLENVQQRPNALSNAFFEGQLQFRVRKDPQKDRKIVEKEQILAVVWQISELLIKVTKIYKIQKFLKGMQNVRRKLQFGM